MEPLQQITKGRTVQDMENELAARTQTVEELNQGLEETGSDFGTETVQQVNALLLLFFSKLHVLLHHLIFIQYILFE